jgi:hypothetical protein
MKLASYITNVIVGTYVKGVSLTWVFLSIRKKTMMNSLIR